MRALDRNAIETIGIPGIVLMENAALAVLGTIEDHYDDIADLTVAVLCGPGNNGGDGFALARHLHLGGADVDVILLADPATLKGDALTNFRLLEALGVTVVEWDDELMLDEYDLLVDAIFGTGSFRAPEGVFADAIQAMNDAQVPVIAIDIPSGVDASTGCVPGEAVQATETVTLQCAKVGLLLPPGREYVGDLIIAPISIPETDDVVEQAAFLLPEQADVAEEFPPRPGDAHKGDFGNLLVIAGSRGMSGAARMVATAALRSGVGLVKVACPEIIRPEVAAQIPEVMTIGLPFTENGTIAASAIEILRPLLAWADAVAIGPGLGTDDETGRFLAALFSAADLSLIIDADALNLIAAHRLIKQLPPGAVLTPHPGEFQRLLVSVNGGQKELDPFARAEAAREFARSYHVTLHLKGAPSITFNPEGLGIVNPTGNPGLATAGSGDVLTGIIASLRAQGFDGADAAWMGAYLHGLAADLAAEQMGEVSLVAGDVIRYLPAAFRALQAEKESDDHSPGGA